MSKALGKLGCFTWPINAPLAGKLEGRSPDAGIELETARIRFIYKLAYSAYVSGGEEIFESRR